MDDVRLVVRFSLFWVAWTKDEKPVVRSSAGEGLNLDEWVGFVECRYGGFLFGGKNRSDCVLSDKALLAQLE